MSCLGWNRLATHACANPLAVKSASLSIFGTAFIVGRKNLQGLPCFGSLSYESRRHYASISPAIKIAHDNVFRDIPEAFSEFPSYEIYSSLQARYPEYSVTVVHKSAGLLDFAKAGEATARLDTEGQNLLSCLKYEPPKDDPPTQTPGRFRNLVEFGRYDYQWNDQSFIVYLHCKYSDPDDPYEITYFVLHKREGDNTIDGQSSNVRDLVAAASSHTNEVREGDVLVWDDDSWTKSKRLWKSVQKSKWDNVILEPTLKDSLIRDVEGFFDQKKDYEEFEPRLAWQWEDSRDKSPHERSRLPSEAHPNIIHQIRQG